MAKDKKIVSVFILDTDNIDGIMDVHGTEEKHPQENSWACAYEDNPAIGTQLMVPKDGEVFQIEDVDAAIKNYKKPEKKKKAPAKKKEVKKKPSKDKGNYNTKVMTPSK